MENDPHLIEEKAHHYLLEEKFTDAFKLFRQAAGLYQAQAKHKQAALCFASAASAWSKKCEEKIFYQAALLYQAAAKEAEKSQDLEYASILYKYAAINYEKDGEFMEFSNCFYYSKDCQRRFLNQFFLNPKKIKHITRTEEERQKVIKNIFSWFMLNLSCLLWGYGERPLRTLFFGIFIIIFASFFYMGAGLLNNGVIFKPNFFEAFYFSVITFTTVGYGDISPFGLARLLAMLEAFSGVFIMPLFIVGLSRKYLRF